MIANTMFPILEVGLRRRTLCALIGVAASGALAQGAKRGLRVVVLSDLNGRYGSVDYGPEVDAAVRRTIALKPDLVLCTGDMVAGQARPALSREVLEAMWGAFHAHVSEPLAKAGLPFAVTPGNHDADRHASQATDRRVYAAQWQARRPSLKWADAPGAPNDWPFRYAFESGPVWFASLDVPFTGALPEADRAWLQRALAGPAARQARQRVLFCHVPLWPFSKGREHEFTGDEALEQLLQEGRVAMVLSGHHHAFYPGVKDGVLHVGQGCQGAAPRPLIGTTARQPRSLTVIDFDAQGQWTLQALAGPAFDTPIDRRSLPERIVNPRATLVRDDLAGRAP